ncbi:coiled-coil domain-containing protein 62 isoform X5 [Peromyscus californicus insignis]|uniref:coiled-coil domain-containing protein 62 isoform X5 n=1 Tax=Peromyscus californicus insignis TaxID=564181 RepID=UPI0022A68A3E|nr:coiled-coil domain-containing protein 62 isoform X5 [Peromyscus californicus insignis]
MRGREGAACRPAGLPAPLRPGAYGVSGVTRWWHRLSLGTGASPMIPSATFFSRRQNIGSEVENSTIEKQRKELQLLIGELKDRDKELNDMVTVHQRQLLSWEEDRQKVLTLEERCSKLEGELHKRTDIIKSLMKKVKMLESNQIECQTALQKTQQQLQEMAQKATHSALLSEDLEARNENLSSTLVELSAQVGQLQAREQALTTMIKLKDKDIIEAVNHISDCSGKFKLLEHALRDAKMAETCIVKEKQDYKQKLKALRFEVSKLKEDLTEKTTENNDQREEIIRLKQEKSCLHDELIFTAEREKRKDELLDIAKSKQDRTNSELHNLRQELPLCCSVSHLRLPPADQAHAVFSFKQKPLTYVFSLFELHCHWEALDELKLLLRSSSCHGWQDGSRDLLEKQKSWSLGGKIQTEPENKVTLCKIHAKSPRSNGPELQMEEKQLSETSISLPEEKQWHDINVYLGLSNCSVVKQPEKLDGDCRDPADMSEISCCTQNEVCMGDSDLCDSKCCHPSNIIVEAPGHMTDVEWMNIFKPSKMQRIVRHKTLCTCSGGVSGMKYNSSASELITIQPPQCLGSSKSAEREDESGASPDKRTSSKSVFISKDAALSNEKDDFSPTSKLQRLLAESRQMVTDLELSTLLPISCENLNRSKQDSVWKAESRYHTSCKDKGDCDSYHTSCKDKGDCESHISSI